MTAVGHESIDHTVQVAHARINELNGPVRRESKARSYRLLRTVIEWLLDRLSIGAAANLGALLPALLRGIYFEHRRPANTPVTERRRQNFLVRIDDAFRTDPLRFTSVVSGPFEFLR
jgi:uncharacterized protein (DUF2267 family)